MARFESRIVFLVVVVSGANKKGRSKGAALVNANNCVKLCHIHISPLVRRPTTTQTSTHQLASSGSESELVERCGHHFVFQFAKNTLASVSCQRLSRRLMGLSWALL